MVCDYRGSAGIDIRSAKSKKSVVPHFCMFCTVQLSRHKKGDHGQLNILVVG